MTERKRQLEELPRDEYDRDLSPNDLAGQNLGSPTDHAQQPHRTAYDLKPVHRALRDWQDDELKAIPVLEEGTALQQGATYINLAAAGGTEITGLGSMTAGPGDLYVPKDEVPYHTWNRLRGINDPDRTGADTNPARKEGRRG